MLDHLTLGLRLREGVSLDAFAERFGALLPEVIGETGEWLVEAGLLEIDDHTLKIPEDRQLITNEILVRLEEALADYVRRETSASQIATR
jgi:oxygen-independent coproporphyrinogen-3 oxidase